MTSLPHAAQYLKPGISFQTLEAMANPYSDNDAARRLNQARAERFQLINASQTHAA